MVSILSGRCQIINKWSQCNVNDVCATCTHYLKLHSMMIHFCAFFCVACKNNALVSCRERVVRFFDMSRERITRFFDVSRKMDPRALSGKFLRVKSRYPESFRFLGLWGRGGRAPKQRLCSQIWVLCKMEAVYIWVRGPKT